MSNLNSQNGGLSFKEGDWPKYKIEKLQGVNRKGDRSAFESLIGDTPIYEPVKGEYWVLKLDPEKDPACVPAMNAYVRAIEGQNPELAADLRNRYTWISPAD